ncbi:hypothetical protein [Micrococcus sp. UYEF12]|uniref:hypothetical protein n=1 Tax=Micrococcus sp. UYEF12 TaxID=1756388 RepID=UPI0033924D87
MNDDDWAPLSVRTAGEAAMAEYWALDETLTPWLEQPVWKWVTSSFMQPGHIVDEELLRLMSFRLKIAPIAPGAISWLPKTIERPWDVVDFLLHHGGHSDPEVLEEVLSLGGSAWTVTPVEGAFALTKRISEGVQAAAEDAFRVDKAGPELVKAWQSLYGPAPDPVTAYQSAVKAVEHASIPLVDPNNLKASLGTVCTKLFQQDHWYLPMIKEHPEVSSRAVLKDMCRVLWDGHAGRHGGDSYGDVTQQDAEVAIGLAVTLVHWFSRGVVKSSKQDASGAA